MDCPEKIKKRDGRIVAFDKNKIVNAIWAAAQAVGGTDKEMSNALANKVILKIAEKFKEKTPSVEDVQDAVEQVLIENGHATTAKAYILYRQQHAKIREIKSVFVDVQETMSEYLDQKDWRVKENSNEDYSFSGLLMHLSGKIVANYTLNEIYSLAIADAHKKGYFHIHDLSHGIVGYSFYRNETIVVRQKKSGRLLCLGIEQLYNLIDSPVIKDNGFEIKHCNNYEVLDENGWTDLQRVLRHETEKSLVSFNSYNGHNLIVTEDHPFITLREEKPLIKCSCSSDNVFKNRSNKNGFDHFKCRACNKTFKMKRFTPDNERVTVLSRAVKLNNYVLTPSIKLTASLAVSRLTVEDAWFVGLFIAEGYRQGNYASMELSKGCAELKKLHSYLKSNGVNYSFYNRTRKSADNLTAISQEITLIRVNIKLLKKEVSHCIVQVRTSSENKNLPAEFLNYEPIIICAMISGIIDGDGTVRTDDKWVSRAVIRVTSKTLLGQIQYGLSAIGISSSLSTIDSYGARSYNGRTIRPRKQLYSLSIFIPKKSKKLFNECIKLTDKFKCSAEPCFNGFSHLRKIEQIKNDSKYVYDVTTASHTFLCNGILSHNCAGWSLKNLLSQGFGNVANKVDAKPAKHLNTVIHQMVNFMGCLQMEFAGAQAFSSVDTLLAPFVRADSLTYKEVKQSMQELVYSLNIPSRWGCQMPFTNVTFDWTTPEDMKNEYAIVGGEMQNSTYGEYQKEMDLINKAFLEVMLEGDAKGRIFTFPIPTYNLTKNFDWDSENAKLLFEVTAKYGTPYFQNYIGSGLDPKSIRAMCCRLNINLAELRSRGNGLFGAGEQTGSIGVVTLNMNRLGYEAKGKGKEEFFRLLKHYMVLAKDSLETKREVIEKNLKNGLMPYTKAYLGTFRNHFSTIGICGMNECCLNFLGKDIASPEGKAFTIEAMQFMQGMLREFQKETGNLYNLEATPAESTAYRLARADKKMHPEIITAGTDQPYLTNSTHLPVNYSDNAIFALQHQNDIQPYYTGGTVFHTFLGEKVSTGAGCMALVKKIAENTKLPYFSITPTFSVCKEHGYIVGEKPKCPTCNAETEVYTRIVGYFRPTKNWNPGKKEEFKDRLEYCENKTMATDFEGEIKTAVGCGCANVEVV